MHLMFSCRLAALAALVLPIALAAVVNAAPARDAALCAPKDATAAEAPAKAEPCDLSPGQKGAVTGKPPVLQGGGAAAKTVITEPVTRIRDFVYRLRRPEDPSGETIILLHGSGGDESSLFKLASRVAPNATLVGVRGRVVQKGLKRWYARVTPTAFDQADIRQEAKAFAASLKAKMAAEQLDLDAAVFIGYSNGANLIAALTLLYPDLVHRAVLLRAMPVLDTTPAADLRRSRFLSVPGKVDMTYGPFAPALEDLLRAKGALVESRMVAHGHLLGDEDVKVVADWLKAANAVAGGGVVQ
ncbi:MAG: alpha/beta hydrolase [Parvibaculaceae bacterium]